jgi:acyl-CoA synthetase (NDP forming)
MECSCRCCLRPKRRGRRTAEPACDAASLRPLFAPRAVAVVGASRDRTSIGGGFSTRSAAAEFSADSSDQPTRSEVHGLPALDPRATFPGVDLAILAVPAPAILGVVDECAAAGVKSLVVVTAGFAEVGTDGRALQDQLVDKVRGYGMRMVRSQLHGAAEHRPGRHAQCVLLADVPAGGTSRALAESGALGLAIPGLAAAREVGLSQFVSVGNKADVSGNDLLDTGKPTRAHG